MAMSFCAKFANWKQALIHMCTINKGSQWSRWSCRRSPWGRPWCTGWEPLRSPDGGLSEGSSPGSAQWTSCLALSQTRCWTPPPGKQTHSMKSTESLPSTSTNRAAAQCFQEFSSYSHLISQHEFSSWSGDQMLQNSGLSTRYSICYEKLAYKNQIKIMPTL